MAFLTRENILNANDANKFIGVEVPEWGGTLNLKLMTGAQRDRFETVFHKDPGNNLRARLVSYVACDDQGKCLFSEADVIALGNKSASALDRVFDAALKHNQIFKEAKDEVAKNS